MCVCVCVCKNRAMEEGSLGSASIAAVPVFVKSQVLGGNAGADLEKRAVEIFAGYRSNLTERRTG